MDQSPAKPEVQVVVEEKTVIEYRDRIVYKEPIKRQTETRETQTEPDLNSAAADNAESEDENSDRDAANDALSEPVAKAEVAA